LTVPAWIAREGRVINLTDGTTGIGAKAHPDLASPVACDGVNNVNYEVEGRFDDPAASTCRANPDLTTGTPIDARVAVYRCRSEFVITRLTRLDSP
jgi:hypothetical protein